MNIPKGIVIVDVSRLRLASLIEIASAGLRDAGNEDDAIALFRLRTKIRGGLSYEEAKPIFDEHTKTLFEEKK